MPLHLPAATRRDFLQTLAAAGVGALVVPGGKALASDGQQQMIALLSDTHVPGDRNVTNRNFNMTENLETVIREILALEERPSDLVINGDCAYLHGLSEDYRSFAATLKPAIEAKLPIHLLMGNHDNRENLYQHLAEQQPKEPPVEGKHVSILETPRVNWFLLDSLIKTGVGHGDLGEAQMQWFLAALDKYSDKPAVVMSHHNPEWPNAPSGIGMQHTDKILAELMKRKHVKAWIYGHLHQWNVENRDGLHLVCLPPTAYVFLPELPNGWVSALPREDGMTLVLHTLDKNHKNNGQKVDLAWR